MKYCYHCGYQLNVGVEQFCPDCGRELEQKVGEAGRDSSNPSIRVTDTKGDTLGTGISGNGNIAGKKVHYTINANVININNAPREFIERLKIIKALQTEVDVQTPLNKIGAKNNSENKHSSINATKQQVKNLLDEIKQIEKKVGTSIEEIRVGQLQISSKDLLLKEAMFEGNVCYYNGDYKDALKWYDKALKIDRKNANAWNNKGAALVKLTKYHKAVKLLEKGLNINPNLANGWVCKGATLRSLEENDKAIECYDKAIEIEPRNPDAWNNKGVILDKLKRHKEAIGCYEKALEIKPGYADAWNNKGVTLDRLEKFKDANDCYKKARTVRRKKSLWDQFLSRFA